MMAVCRIMHVGCRWCELQGSTWKHHMSCLYNCFHSYPVLGMAACRCLLCMLPSSFTRMCHVRHTRHQLIHTLAKKHCAQDTNNKLPTETCSSSAGHCSPALHGPMPCLLCLHPLRTISFLYCHPQTAYAACNKRLTHQKVAQPKQ